jgi:hypothetical protein
MRHNEISAILVDRTVRDGLVIGTRGTRPKIR